MKTSIASLTVLILLLFGTVIAYSDGMILPDDPDMGWLTVTYHHVTVTAHDGIVITRVDQEFENDTSYPIEGRYVFPLPSGATVSEFSMWIDGRRTEGTVLPGATARALYTDYVRRVRDPALLEYIDRTTLAARVSPIPPGETRRIEIAYTELLTANSGIFRYWYPLDTERFSAAAVGDVQIDVNISTSAPLQAVYSPTHRLTVTRSNANTAIAHYEAHDLAPDNDFVLYYSVLPEKMGMTLFTYNPDGKDGFFLVIISPTVTQSDNVLPKDLVFVLDTSGSMAGSKLVQAKAALQFVLNNLNRDDQFAVIAFSAQPRAQHPALTPVTASAVATASKWIEKLTAAGGTNIDAALSTALALFPHDARPHYVIFLTDGQPTVGVTTPTTIIANVNDKNRAAARIFAFGVGDDVNTFLLDHITQDNHGTTVYVSPTENIETAVASFYRKIASPVLISPQIAIHGVSIYDLYPDPLPDVFQGSQLLIVGRYSSSGSATISLTGNIGGTTAEFTATRLFPKVAISTDFLPRIWAGRKIAYLLDEIRLHGEKQELIDTVIALSKRYGIITPYTSFLVEEPNGTNNPAGNAQQAANANWYQMPSASTGAQAVASAKSIRTLAEEPVAPPAAGSVRVVGDRAFFQRDGVWIESTYTGEKTIAIVAYSKAYFDLLAIKPELADIFAIGDRLIFRVAAVYVEIGPTGAETLPDELRQQIEN